MPNKKPATSKLPLTSIAGPRAKSAITIPQLDAFHFRRDPVGAGLDQLIRTLEAGRSKFQNREEAEQIERLKRAEVALAAIEAFESLGLKIPKKVRAAAVRGR